MTIPSKAKGDGMSERLLPCPFCGGAAIQCGNNELNPRHWIMCEACHACPGGDVPELANAVEAWNTRAHPPTPEASDEGRDEA